VWLQWKCEHVHVAHCDVCILIGINPHLNTIPAGSIDEIQKSAGADVSRGPNFTLNLASLDDRTVLGVVELDDGVVSVRRRRHVGDEQRVAPY